MSAEDRHLARDEEVARANCSACARPWIEGETKAQLKM